MAVCWLSARTRSLLLVIPNLVACLWRTGVRDLLFSLLATSHSFTLSFEGPPLFTVDGRLSGVGPATRYKFSCMNRGLR